MDIKNNYKIHELIGKGTFGKIFKAQKNDSEVIEITAFYLNFHTLQNKTLKKNLKLYFTRTYRLSCKLN